MGIGSIFSKIFNTLQPVYDLAQFGEEFHLIPWINTGSITQLMRAALPPLLRLEETSIGSATLEMGGAAAASSSIDQTFERSIDMPAWLFSLHSLLIVRLTAGAGNTVTLSGRLNITALDGNIVIPVSDRTLTIAGLVANDNFAFNFAPLATNILIPQHALIRVQIVITATRTAGAAALQVFYVVNQANELHSGITLHLHPAYNHADTVFGTGRAS